MICTDISIYCRLCIAKSLHGDWKTKKGENFILTQLNGYSVPYTITVVLLLVIIISQLECSLIHGFLPPYSSVLVNMANPGVVLTSITKSMPVYMRFFDSLLKPLFLLLRKQPEHGAFTVTHVATSPLLRCVVLV